MNSMLVSSHLNVQVEASSSVADAVSAVPRMPSDGFFRGLLVGLGIVTPFWVGVAWLGLKLLHLG